MTHHTMAPYLVTTALLFGAASAAAAAEPIVSTPPSVSAAHDLGAQTMSNADLSETSGGQNVYQTMTNQTLTAATSGNSLTANVINTGAISFSKDTFQGFNGVGNFVVNSGNNNVLQGALSLTIAPLR